MKTRPKPKPYLVDLCYPTGNPQEICLADNPNCTVSGILFHRSCIDEIKERKELDKAGIYFLIQSEPGELPAVYIGESDVLRNRLINYYKKDFWDQGVFFTAKDKNLNKSRIKYLEATFYQIAEKLNKCTLKNKNTPRLPQVSESDQVYLNIFTHDILNILPAMNISFFTEQEVHKDQMLFYIEQPKKRISASGFESGEGFILLKGSTISAKTVASCPPAVVEYREECCRGKIIEKIDGKCPFMKLKKDIKMSSPSAAAAMVTGYSVNGRDIWKNKAGVSLKTYQLKKVKE